MHPGGKYQAKDTFDLWPISLTRLSGHCKKLAPEYSQAAQALANNDPAYPLAKVDATEQKKLAERFGIQGFPTLKFFK